MITKIFFYVPSYGISVGGAEVQADRLAKELRVNHKIDIHILSLNGAYVFDENDVLKRVFCFTQRKSLSIFSRIKHLKDVLSYIMNNKHAGLIVHFHTLSNTALLIGLLIKLSCTFSQNPSLIYKMTRTGYNSPLQQHLKPSVGFFLFKLQLLISSKFISLSPSGSHELLKSGVKEKNIFLIPNGINLPTLKNTFEWKNRNNIYVVIGRVIKRKCLPQIINAWLNANRKKDDILLIIGDGPELPEIKQNCNKNHKNHNIKFFGHLDHESILKMLLVSKYYVSASESEGLSNSLLEGMAYGLLPIVRKIPENEFVVEDKHTGFLFSTEDELRHIFSHPRKMGDEEKLSVNSFRVIKDNFDIRLTADKYMKLINRLTVK